MLTNQQHQDKNKTLSDSHFTLLQNQAGFYQQQHTYYQIVTLIPVKTEIEGKYIFIN